MSSPAESLDSEAYRTAGNQAFEKKDFDTALIMYTLAIENFGIGGDSTSPPPPPPSSSTNPPPPPSTTPLHTHYCNRSLVYTLMSSFPSALSDAKSCIKLSHGKNVKGYFRMAKALVGMGLYGDAMEGLEEAMENRKDKGEKETKEREDIKKLYDNIKARKKVYDKKVERGEIEKFKIKSIKTDGRKPSVKEFDFLRELGTGNFTRIVQAKHKETGEVFAVKVVEKKQVENIKRRHPNVHNEIQMEKRVLSKLSHPFVVTLYHTFQDYNALYYLMDFCGGNEMWTNIMYTGKLTGAHSSLARFWLAELVEVMDYIQGSGIVHRDLKPENLMVGTDGHLKVIDFGTAKDLVETDLNGPEFVGTPEFMSPECVRSKKASYEADLWSLGVVMWQLLLGTTPFKAPSPYLGFLKIKRGNLYRHPALQEDEWDLINKLVKVKPDERIGAGRKFDDIKKHPYFAEHYPDLTTLHEKPAETVPTLKDLCIRAVAEQAIVSSLDPEAADPGAGGSDDMLRMKENDRERVMHFLDRLKKLHEPRVLRRFYTSTTEAKMSRVRPQTRDFLGLTSERESQYEKPIDFVQITPSNDIDRMKSIIKAVNKKRPKFAVVTGKVPDKGIRKVCAKISETVPFVMADGSDFFVFYAGGIHGIVICGELIVNPDADKPKYESMMNFLSQELEQSRMCQHHTYVFTDVDTRRLPVTFYEKVSKSRVSAIMGPSEVGTTASGMANYTDPEFTKKFVLDQEGRPVPMDIDEKKAAGSDSVYPEEEHDSDVDSDGYSMVDEDSNVQLITTAPGANVIATDHELKWNISTMQEGAAVPK